MRELAFTHFTVLLEPVRRLALAPGVNLDGARLLDLNRGDDWHLDPRAPADEQVGPEVYADNDLDRTLTRHRAVVVGMVVRGQADTEMVTGSDSLDADLVVE